MESQDEGSGPPAKRAKRLAPTSRGSSSYSRKRAVTACQVCRSRRTKCDNKKPKCSFCERTGAECVMAPDAMSTFDPASLRILERLDEMQSLLQASIRSSIQQISPLPCPRIWPAARRQYASFSGNIEAVLEWPIIKQYIKSGSSPLEKVQATSTQSCDSVSSLNADLDPVQCDELLDNFFRYVHIKNPVLEERQTRRMVRRVFSEGLDWDQESCLALIICANGAIVRSYFEESLSSSEIRGSLGPVLLRAAQKRLGTVIGSHGLLTAQCLFYFGVYQMCIQQPHDAWRMFLQALASCQQFGFLTNAEDTSTPSGIAHAEECIYWSCWKSERELRWVLKLQDFGELANDHPKSFPSLPEGLVNGEELVAWYFYLSEISLWRLSTRARREMKAFEPNPGNDFLESLVELSKSLQEKAVAWSQSLAPAIRLDRVCSQDEGEVLSFILRGHVTSFYEAIWWPFVDAAVNHGDTSPQVLSCATEGLKIHLDCLTINRPGFRYRHHGTWLLQQSCIRSALVLTAASKSEIVAHLLPVGWEAAVQATIDMLQYWRREGTIISCNVIELLETLLKS